MVTQWTASAQSELKKIYDYIKKDSPQNARKVRDKIVYLSESLTKYPERFPLDKYKTNNNGQYRVFIAYRYRISYRILKEEIIIVRIQHTSMSPQMY